MLSIKSGARPGFGTLIIVAAALWVLSSTIAGCKTTTTTGSRIYLVRVEAGDTLSSIAAKYDTTWEKIARLNGLSEGSAIRIGQVLRVPPGPGGLVAGAKPAPASARRTAGAREAPLDNAADEFTEADFPDDRGSRRRGGLLFNGGKNGANLSWPLHGKLSSHFGMRGGRPHRGIDISAPRGTVVRAAGRGIVEFAGRQNGYGRTVIVRHHRHKTLYAHLHAVYVKRGDRVDELTKLGTVGTSGNASGPHLHFEVRARDDKALNPLDFLDDQQLLSSRH